MPELRTLTIVKTDVGRFTDRVGDMTSEELDAYLAGHRRLVERVVAGSDGHIVKEIGDSFLVTFPSSTQAVLTCVELQREVSLANAGKPDARRIDIRIAVAAGDVLIQDGDIFGTPVNLVARVEGITPPGEIWFTESVFHNLNRREVACEYVGSHALKGIPDPVRVYRTTFQHQTRVLDRAAVMSTRLHDFTEFAESADPGDVERVLDHWEQGHRAAAATRGGTVQLVVGDRIVMIFNDVSAAVGAWRDLCTAVDTFGGQVATPIVFSSGVSVGPVRMFRSAIYGRVLAESEHLCDAVAPQYGGGCLALPEEVFSHIEPAVLTACEARPAEPMLPPPGAPNIDAVILVPHRPK